MSSDKAIFFKHIPKDFKNHEKVYVMQYEFSGIQAYIFGNVTLSSTREAIQKRSEYIVSATDCMESRLNNNFSRFEKFRTLSKSSGKLICAVSHRAKESKIRELSDEIQRIIYASTNGRLEMFYGICRAEICKQNNETKEKNAMSVLVAEVNHNKFHCTNILGANTPENRHMDFIPSDANEQSDKDTDAIMVAVKFDLDNLGSFFHKVTSFDERKSVSECLANILKSAFVNVKNVYPIFIGGDDLFAIASLDSYYQAIAQMYNNIKHAILHCDELADYRDSFGISGGISFIRNDLGKFPLVYYFKESEEQLMRAKNVSGKNVVAVPNCILSWEQLQTLSTVLTKYRNDLFRDLSNQQRINMYLKVRELKSRILSIQKNTRGKLLTKEEETNVYNIH